MMKKVFGLLLPILLGFSAASAKDRAPREITLSGDYTVSGNVVQDEGQLFPMQLEVDGATPSRPVLNQDFAERADVEISPIRGVVLVGPVKLQANTKILKYRIAGSEKRRRALWADRIYAPDSDGGIGPLGLPQEIIHLQWREEKPGEQLCTMQLETKREAVAELRIDGKAINVTFTHKRGQTLSSAAAGAVIAEQYDGEFTGERTEVEIAFGIERPIRKIALRQPLSFCDVTLDSFYVRTSDFGDASDIVDGDLRRANADSSEIIVIGKQGTKDKNRYFLTVGQDDLQHCSSVTYDQRRKEIRLSCLAE
ncbi:MAG: hypothetical protein AAGH53_07860 [Pseudomonadota bacterium]